MLAAVLALALVIPPAPTARVNDYAGLLNAGERARLETALAEHERATSSQMVIAVFPSLDGENLEDYSIRLAQQWRVGQKSLDNGVILLVFVKERKVRLEVGYGLEPVVTDAVAGQIIREVIAPRFREGRYASGLEAAVEAVFTRVASGPLPERPKGDQRAPVWPLVGFGAVLLVVAVVLLQEMLSTRRVARRNVYSAGRDGWSAPIVVIPPMRGRGGGNGGFDGGGFSGGGGSFGGGGASGEW